MAERCNDKCIICDENIALKNEEHIFPDAIGGNLKVYTLCKLCNSKLGNTVDNKLVHDDFIKSLRYIFCLL